MSGVTRKAGKWTVKAVLIAFMFLTTDIRAEVNSFAPVADRTFDVLSINGQCFSNVTVFSRSKTHVILSHNAGLTGLEVSSLDPATLRRIGYKMEADAERGGDGFGVLPLRRFWSMFSDVLGSEKTRWYGVGAIVVFICIVVGLYLFTSYLFWLICVRTETSPGIAVWLPFIQAVPLLRAARITPLWALALVGIGFGAVYARSQTPVFAPWLEVLGLICGLGLWLAWSLRICQLRKKSALLAVALAVPGINYLALMYLAGSK